MVSNPGFRSGNAKRDLGINRLHGCRRKLVPLAALSLQRGRKQASLKLLISIEDINDCPAGRRMDKKKLCDLVNQPSEVVCYLWMLMLNNE